ncbi:MAG: PHP domain-containing protein [Limnochordia bacterium]|jgi:predicted metal-dependent phosphoesterase TrpH|nr:PHP domain-containing protein [Bacillota bacterium]
MSRPATTRIDLHVHTNASDGTLSAKAVVKLAAQLNLEAISITDHDSVAGIDEAQAAASSLGLLVIPGVELSIDKGGSEIHLLGYLLDHHYEPLTRTLKVLRDERLDRVKEIVHILNQMGYPISLARVRELAGNGSIGRLHVARCLVEAGAVPSIKEAFARLLGRNRPAYVPRYKLSVEEAIELIKSSGGIPVLAHPGLLGDEGLVSRLCDQGIAGLEVYHPDHTEEQSTYYRDLCTRKGLLITGGSDYHGPGAREGAQLGTKGIDRSELARLYQSKGLELSISGQNY